MRRRLLALLAPALLSACAVGPNFKPPPAPQGASYGDTPQSLAAASKGGSGETYVWGGAVEPRWWEAFGSPELNRLVGEALVGNADLAAAKAALRNAHELYLAQKGALLPTVTLDAQGSRNRSSAALSPVTDSNALYYSLFQYQGSLSYTFDVFGGVRRQIEAAAAQADQQRWQSEAAYNTLTANLVSALVLHAAAQAEAALTEREIQDYEDALRLTRLQQTQGQSSGLDVAAAQAQLGSALSALPALRRQRDQERDLIAALTGRTPGELPPLTTDFAALSLPRSLPVSLPARLVRQRPDLRAAEANVHQASAQVGVALANRLPNFQLTADAGGVSTAFSQLTSPPNVIWSILGDASATLFDAGTLKHRQRAAEAALDQAKAQYRSTLLSAFQNVADVLAALKSDDPAVAAAKASFEAADRTLKLTQLQANQGQASALPVLAAAAAADAAELTLRQAEAQRLQDVVALYVALGGGWEGRQDSASAAQASNR